MVTEPASPRMSERSANQPCACRVLQQRTSEGDGLVDGVNVLSLCLVDLDLPRLVTGDETGRLDDRAGLEGTNGHGRKERGEEEVVTGGDDDLVDESATIKVFNIVCSKCSRKETDSVRASRVRAVERVARARWPMQKRLLRLRWAEPVV